MPNPNPQVDFALPGWLTTPSTRHTCLLSLASAYSRRWNPRNLEHPWYEPWAQILQALVADLPPLAVAPQSYLWYYRHPGPGDYHIEPPSTKDASGDDEDEWCEEADTTLDSVTSIHVGSRRNKYQLVDFAITRKVSRNRSPPVYPAVAPTHIPNDHFVLSHKVEYLGIPILCELKRGAPRMSNIRISLEHAHRQLRTASEQLVRQAHHLFEMYSHQEEILLIAATGLWWSYRILPRNESKAATTAEIEAAEYEEANIEPDAFEEPKIHADVQDSVVDVILGPDLARDQQDPSGLPLIYHGLENITFRDQISDDYPLHLLMTQTNFRLVTTSWSPPLLFGTPPSNQEWYLIHQHLETIVNDGFNGRKG